MIVISRNSGLAGAAMVLALSLGFAAWWASSGPEEAEYVEPVYWAADEVTTTAMLDRIEQAVGREVAGVSPGKSGRDRLAAVAALGLRANLGADPEATRAWLVEIGHSASSVGRFSDERIREIFEHTSRLPIAPDAQVWVEVGPIREMYERWSVGFGHYEAPLDGTTTIARVGVQLDAQTSGGHPLVFWMLYFWNEETKRWWQYGSGYNGVRNVSTPQLPMPRGFAWPGTKPTQTP